MKGVTDDRSNWLSFGILSFFGAVVANIIFPERRGVGGFISATIVGVACGSTAGVIALAYEVHPGTQLIITFCVGMLSYRILNAIFVARSSTNITTNVYGNQQQNVGQTGGDADINAGLGWTQSDHDQGDDHE